MNFLKNIAIGSVIIAAGGIVIGGSLYLLLRLGEWTVGCSAVGPLVVMVGGLAWFVGAVYRESQ